MDTLKAVPDAVPDPKEGKPRAQSGVSFPYFDLDSSIDVARRMHVRAGGTCDLAQLATLLKYSKVTNGSFRSRVSAAKMFGVIQETENNRLQVSQRGLSIVAPIDEQQEAKARADAFLAVDLFKRIFDRFNGTTLPGAPGLKNLLQTEYRVVPARIAPTVRILLDSAEQAGFFRTAGNRSRMVRPLEADAGSVKPAAPGDGTGIQREAFVGEPPVKERGGGGGGGFGGDGMPKSDGIDPALSGLLQRLPPEGERLTEKRRKALVAAFEAFINVIYPEEDA